MNSPHHDPDKVPLITSGLHLTNLSIASPCSTNWNEMAGDEQTRHCQECQLNVYNLSNMTRQEAETLIQKKEGRLCVRFYRRLDGTILTKDCPVGKRVLHQRQFKRLGKVAAVISIVTLIGLYTVTQTDSSTALASQINRTSHPIDRLGQVIAEPTPKVDNLQNVRPLMGKPQPYPNNHPDLNKFIMGGIGLPPEPPPQTPPKE